MCCHHYRSLIIITDPLHLRHCGHDLSIHQLFHLSKFDAAFIDCQVWVAIVDGEIGSVATVAQPGKKLEEKQVFKQRAFEPLNEEVRSWMATTFNPLQAKVDSSIPGGALQSYYVQGIATHPSFQGKGLASAILGRLTNLAKKENTCVALITVSARAATVYHRNGFKITYEDNFTYDQELGDAPFCIMVNDPSEC
ncbi:hypothetical protein V865_001559 [Kwoniella europaea PYCC6329]|uniref:N-acetyltransferase domain-containing protein n=1 Tax=Kwoniella europaea PYCC6329 TaxID=1423913 RepID=A0AAX4KAK5_9TREE